MSAKANRVRLRSAAHQMYDGRRLSPGDEFYAPEADAEDLIALRFATRVVTPPPAIVSEAASGIRRVYRRRDMKAEK